MEKNKEEFLHINLAKLCPNPWNPRKRFTGQKFDELVASIREKDVLEPILARRIAAGPKLVSETDWPNHGHLVEYEVIAGERRFRASYLIAQANGGPEAHTIPAIVKDLSDDEAFDVMTIENIQREDLTELEEARNFQMYLDRKGPEAIDDLAARTGIHPAYIRRRLRVLALPKKVLTMWDEGQLKYGHLEQLCRLKGAPEVNRWCKELEDHAGRIMSVTDLKRRIDHQSPALSLAHFDIEKAGCVACAHNSDVQKVLFAVDQSEKTICTNPVCFKKKQKNYLAANWAKSALRKKFRTNGYVFNEDWNWMRNDNFYTAKEVFPECKDCERFVTVLHATGEVYYERGCLDKTCKSKLSHARKAGGRGAGSNPEAGAAPGPRVAWHGQHFREIFYQEKIRERVEVLLLSDPEAWQDHKILRMLLFGLLCHAGSTLGAWFAKRNMLTDDTEGSFYFLDRDQALARILDMSREDVGFDLAGAALELILSSNAAPEQRRAIGELLGIDLASEWRVTEEYLTKKTTPELLAFGETSGIFADPAALAFVSGLGRRSYKACKKSELVKVFLESGAELVGKVPAEILNKG